MTVSIPQDSIEKPFLEYWSSHLLDPRDPQNQRWLSLELQQVERGHSMAERIAAFQSLEGANVLDVGCQTGGLAIAMALRGATVTGIDVSDDLVHAANLRAGCHQASATFRVAKAESLPFESGTLDLVTFVDVIEHVEDATRSLAEIARVLKPGGVLYLQGPNRFSPRWFLKDPHYQMAGISVLPPSLGRFYVTRIRRRPRYDVGVFPTGSTVVATLGSLGMELLHSPKDEIRGPLRGLRAAVALRLASMFTLVARKRA